MHPFVKRWIVGEVSWWRVVRSVVLIYVGFMAWAYFYAEKIIFPIPPRSYADTPEIIKVATPRGEHISALALENTAASPWILHSHGNYEDLGTVRPFLDEVQAMGFSVMAFDYSGYGTSEGRPTERTVYEDALAVFDYMTNAMKIAPGRIIVHGRSVGAAMAVEVAAKRPVGGLVIESGFVTAFRVRTVIPISPFDRFRNIRKIRDVRCPVLVFHGREDEIIPFWHGEALFAAAPDPKRSVWVDGAGHNDLFWVCGKRYEEELRAFAELVEAKR
jgi:fermentation-respiration switch protein FrsA (DUF1100 family)